MPTRQRVRSAGWTRLSAVGAMTGLLVLSVVVSPALASPPAWSSPHVVASNLNGGAAASVNAISCPVPGACAAGGSFTDGKGTDAFVVAQHDGHFSAALEVAAALNTGAQAAVGAISCSAAGDCGAGGSYTSALGAEAFVTTESNGHWGPAVELAAALNVGNDAYVQTISCTGPGDCTAGGGFQDATGSQAFVATESHGHWGPAVTVAGLLNAGLSASVSAVSCTAPGDCAAGGQFAPAPPGTTKYDPFVVSETHGHWSSAEEVAATINTQHEGYVASISCSGLGACGAAGADTGASGPQGFVVSEAHGHWGAAAAVRGAPPNPKDFPAGASTISCASAGTASRVATSRSPEASRPTSRRRRRVTGASSAPWPSRSMRRGTPRSGRCRAPRPATALPSATT